MHNAITTGQIARIHAAAKAAGLDEDSRRDLLEGLTGKRSSRDLTRQEAARVIDRLNVLTASVAPPGRRPGKTMSGRWSSVLRALWLAGYHLGVIENRDDSALIAFIERQTKITHPRFLIDREDASTAIEGLKAWLSREAGVDWSAKHFVVQRGQGGAVTSSGEIRCPKRNVIAAQLEIFRQLDLPCPDVRLEPETSDADLDTMMACLGHQLRHHLRGRQSGRAQRRA